METSFILDDGYTATVGPEEGRIYDRIIESNVGVVATTGLGDDQVRNILSKSHLSEPDVEHIWQLTTTIDAEGLPEGGWTRLEVYVALHFVQQFENLSLDQMAAQFAGPIPLVTKKIRRRSSYAQAGGASNSTAIDPIIHAAPSAALLRTQSLAETSIPPTAILLRHSPSDASATVRLRGTSAYQTLSDHDNSSVSQAGLEAMDAIAENEDWEGGHPPTQSVPFHIRSSHRNHSKTTDFLEGVSRRSSIRTDTAGRAERLETLVQAKSPKVARGPVIEASGPWTRQASVIDRSHAHDILVRSHTGHPKYKDPSAGLAGLLKSKKSKQKASDDQNWVFNKEELSLALQEALESGHVGVAEVLIDLGADVNFRTTVAKRKLHRNDVRSVPTNHIKIAASTSNIDMVRLLASHGASSTNQAEALDTAVKQNLPGVVETLLKYDADPNSIGGTIFQSAITTQNAAIVKLLLRARKGVLRSLLNACLPTAVEQGQVEIVSLLVLYGADVNDDHALALRKAVQSQRADLLLATMKGNPSSQSVSLAFEDAFLPNSPIGIEDKYLLLDILLCGGANGNPVAEVLIRVVRAGHCGIARMLIAHGASLDFKRAAALKQAVIAQNVRMLNTLSLGRISSACATDVFTEIPQPFVERQTKNLMSPLISKGAKGIPLDKALVSAVQQKLEDVTVLLLDHKASADYNDAQALQIAATAGDIDTVILILSKGKPQPQSMRYVLPLIPPGPPRLRYDMTKSIIDAASPAGIPTPLLDVALMEAVDTQSLLIDLDLVNLVIVAGADVNCLGGKSFQTAAKRESIELLELLVRSAPQPSSLSSAVPVAMRLADSGLRMRFMVTLLDHGAQGPAVAQTLTEAIGEKPLDEDLVLYLVKKANVDHHQGQALCNAVKCANIKIVASVIDLGHPNHQSRLAALSIVLEPATEDRLAKLDLLLRAGIHQEGLDRALIQEISNESNSEIKVIEMLLNREASCNYDRGKSLEIAVRSRNNQVLRCLVSSKCDSPILAKLLPLAMHNVDPNTRHACMALLLSGGAKGDQVSRALVHEICSSQKCHPQLVKLLIDHGARVDYSEGQAIKNAASKPMTNEVLKLLFEGQGASTVLVSLIPLAMNHAQETRLQILQMLLEKGARGAQVHVALIEAVKQGPHAQPTIDMLLQYNASVDYQNGEVIKIAAAAGHSSILDCLLQRNPNSEHLPEALRLAMQTPAVQSGVNIPVRLKSVRLLTRAGVANSVIVHQALIQAVIQKDHALVDHLIRSGADPNFESGECVITATKQADIESLVLLARAKPSPAVFSAAFAAKSTSIDRWRIKPELLLNIDKILLDGGAVGPAVDQVFLTALKSSDSACNQFVDMVFARPSLLNVNYDDGKCLCTAVRKNLHELVKTLLNHRPNQRTLCSAFMAIFESHASEEHLISLSKLFFERSKSRKHLYFGQDDDPLTNPLYQTLHRHSDKPLLLQHLLDSGCPPDSRFLWEFSSDIGAEETSPLLWLLCQAQADQQTDKRTVDILLVRGADPNFRTSGSGNSPLIIAAISSQPDIILQLLEAHANANVEDKYGRTPLQCATRVGRLESVEHLLNFTANLDDESLHIAARLTKASVVKLLLDRGASIDWLGIHTCDYRTPLGELCRTASPARDPAQLKETLNVFAKAQPDVTKLTNDKSLVFLALDNDSPFAMTTALLKTFRFLRENLNADFNIFRGQGGFCYSLTMYVRYFKCSTRVCDRSLDSERQCCNNELCPAPVLEKLLREFGCRDRFWVETAGANQPPGVCSPPAHILEAQKIQEKQTRLRAEERARQERIQADLDKAAKAELKRERQRLAVLEEKRRADANEDRRRLDPLEETREADLRNERRRVAAVQNEQNAESERKRREFSEQQDRARSARVEEERHVKRRNDLEAAAMERQAKITAGVLREKRRMIDSVSQVVQQAQISGVGGQRVGRILGEVGEGGRFLE
ncbi:MAG: hypothetical protein ASARMPRED_002104 [Alectoria sarmentosa]|nr:MAG: hypothetical protein ASARMPRED_002104 [Alectoria sarmentosa]